VEKPAEGMGDYKCQTLITDVGFDPANVYGLSRTVPTRGSSATQRVALLEPAWPAGQWTAPCRLLTGVGRSRTLDMGFVAGRGEDEQC
jgi:hypothetical protein